MIYEVERGHVKYWPCQVSYRFQLAVARRLWACARIKCDGTEEVVDT